MKYWLWSLRAGTLLETRYQNEVYNVAWKRGEAPFDVAVLVVDDGRTVRVESLGAGFVVDVQVEKPKELEKLKLNWVPQ